MYLSGPAYLQPRVSPSFLPTGCSLSPPCQWLFPIPHPPSMKQKFLLLATGITYTVHKGIRDTLLFRVLTTLVFLIYLAFNFIQSFNPVKSGEIPSVVLLYSPTQWFSTEVVQTHNPPCPGHWAMSEHIFGCQDL